MLMSLDKQSASDRECHDEEESRIHQASEQAISRTHGLFISNEGKGRGKH